MTQMPKGWYPTHEHHHALDQVLGKHGARDLYYEEGRKIPCAYCGAGVGEDCTTDRGMPTLHYQHQARRKAASSSTDERIWRLTHEVVEAKRRGEPALLETGAAPYRIRLRPKITVDLDPKDDQPIAVRLGLAAARVIDARRIEERAWSELGRAREELAGAEKALASIASRLGLDVESILAADQQEAAS